MTETTELAPDQLEEKGASIEEVLEELARLYLRTVALPLPRNPATLAWQTTAGGLAALAARALYYVALDDSERAAALASFYRGPLGDGPHPLGVGLWIERNITKPAGADIDEWAAEAKEGAQAALAAASKPTGLRDLGAVLGDDVLALLISGLGASWKEWEERGSTRRLCFLPGCTHEVDLVAAWSGTDGSHGEGWMSSSAVGYACPEHAARLWANDCQHIPAWQATGGGSSAELRCTCGWASGAVAFRGHGTTLYQVHALEVLGARA
ncbi:hypothetical protein [Streptomyces javensis]|uniref:Uncharacterized protein n=1 Tax=Streptomyces javensis TaxID=114698 RepID=A0ABS0RDH4_9ACTN|nr:hypothetical protein [Streptomyces javensis]MBI0314752.1 hypothetical protein [Streptomyces javensis]